MSAKQKLEAARDAAYQRWMKAADRGYQRSAGRYYTYIGDLKRVDARIRALRERYSALAKLAKESA